MIKLKTTRNTPPRICTPIDKASAYVGELSGQKQVILQSIIDFYRVTNTGLNYSELEACTGYNRPSVAAACKVLKDKNLIKIVKGSK